MFYSTDILVTNKNGGLGVIWLAGTLGPKSQARRLQKRDYCSVKIPDACSYLQAPPEPMSLRLSASMMVGVTRVYSQQCMFYYGDVANLWSNLERVESAKRVDQDILNGKKESIDLAENGRAPREAITLMSDHQSGNHPASSTATNMNVWSELEKYKMATPEVGRLQQSSSTGTNMKSDIPGRFSGTPLRFGPNDGSEGLLRELLLMEGNHMMDDLVTPNSSLSSDAFISGIFTEHRQTDINQQNTPSSVVRVPDRPNRKVVKKIQIDEQTMLTREEMFDEPVKDWRVDHNNLTGESIQVLLCRASVNFDGVQHANWDNIHKAPIIVPEVVQVAKKKRRSSLETNSKSAQSDQEEDVIVPWSEPFSVDEDVRVGSTHDSSNHENTPSVLSKSGNRDKIGFLKFMQNSTGNTRGQIAFDELFPPNVHDRKVVSRAFHNVLQAACEGKLQVRQDLPYGKIMIKIK